MQSGKKRAWTVTAAAAIIALLGADIGGVLAVGGRTSGNGEASKPAATVLADAERATIAAEPVRVQGSGEFDSDDQQSADFVFTPVRSGGTFETSSQHVSVVVTPTATYLRGESAVIRTLLGRRTPPTLTPTTWVEARAADADVKDLRDLGDLRSVLTPLAGEHFTVGGTSTYDHRSALPLHGPPASGQTLWVAASGAPVILAITTRGAAGDAITSFSEYGTAIPPPVPPATVDLDRLQQAPVATPKG